LFLSIVQTLSRIFFFFIRHSMATSCHFLSKTILILFLGDMGGILNIWALDHHVIETVKPNMATPPPPDLLTVQRLSILLTCPEDLSTYMQEWLMKVKTTCRNS
jgi:hypothetical protein